MKISEIFYAIQGEGTRQGKPSLFVRLQGCSAKYACYQSGIRCDTEFESGSEISNEDLLIRLRRLSSSCEWIVWTGGEPLDQLTEETIDFFRSVGFLNAIETSGIRPMSQDFFDKIDHLTISPKVAEHVLAKNFPFATNTGEDIIAELRYVRHKGQGIPEPILDARDRFLSPHSDGFTINQENLKHCERLCLDNPSWRLSIQAHKLIGSL